jgi:hypothetical protein
MSSINVFIPRILSTVSKRYVKETFEKMNIGNVKYIDMRRRMNEKRNVYSFAFLAIDLEDNPKSMELYDKINTNGSAQLYYDSEHYWELKHYIPYDERDTNNYLEIDELCRLLTKVPTSFTESDAETMKNEFDELQKETYNLLELSNAIHEKPKIKYYSLF